MSNELQQKQIKSARLLVMSMSLMVLSQVIMLMNQEPIKRSTWFHFGTIVVCLVMANVTVFMIPKTGDKETEAGHQDQNNETQGRA